MVRKVNFYGVCIACGLCLLVFLAGSRYTDNVNYRPAQEGRRNIRNYLRTTSEDLQDTNNFLTQSKLSTDNPVSYVDGILDKARLKILSELSSFNFSNNFGAGVNKLSDLVLESGGEPIRSVIISTWRSGTTFLGEILNAVPATFYHYEPLLQYEIIQIRGAPYADSAVGSLKKLLKCNYSDMEDYFEYGKTHMHLFHHNSRLWEYCKHDKSLCFDPVFTSNFCKLFPFQSMKVVRLRLRLVEELLKDDELSNMKVILLIRDPRGVLQSRQHRNFCPPAPDCSQPALLCADMVSDYVAAANLMRAFPERFTVLRYEDMALNASSAAQYLLRFLNLREGSQAVDDFLRSHTTTAVGGVSSTYRVSRNVPFRWKSLLDFAFVSYIQSECKEAMTHWGYRMAHNATHMASKEFDPLDDYQIV